MKSVATLFFALVVILGNSLATPAQNYKIKQTTSLNGQNITSTIYVKGSRKRSESSGIMGMTADVATIEQCDLKRTVQLNDKRKMYFIEPFATDETAATPPVKPVRTQPGNVTKGGTVTITTSINDTGERKQMFGLTARHIKTTMTSRSSPDACSKSDMNIETDGWYVDLPLFSCPVSVPRNPMGATSQPKQGCQDRMIIKTSGGGKLGFALQLTTTMKSGDGDGMAFSQSLETVEFTRSVLADALFDLPANYTPANSAQDLYSRPDYSSIMRGQDNPQRQTSRTESTVRSQSPPLSQVKRPGTIRIGVLAPTNRSQENFSSDQMQSFLVGKLTSGNTEGFAVSSEAQAREAGCDYILSSDFSKLKQSTASKIGGIFGKVTNTDTSSAQKIEAQVDFKLVSLKTGQTMLQNKAAGKTESSVDGAVEGVLATEAISVLAVAR
ncbi:MAG TPA: hypothetical protein PLP07_13350 [Pyrinomonadaceae bacterium]|nr:hypothetical protein [Chloracidobacterium sp.]MBP9935309.1 hypothetical protein [Pyrinomonadaceae bacterium]MBK7804542.1 hypothetical protein [Chloracidobacterium sp.]MBL0240466.1 hypothetical protein [Chloracidobacterium sp.]HQX56908.1 hypothetical protein [Pyrinomonadaceae bacterium]